MRRRPGRPADQLAWSMRWSSNRTHEAPARHQRSGASLLLQPATMPAARPPCRAWCQAVDRQCQRHSHARGRRAVSEGAEHPTSVQPARRPAWAAHDQRERPTPANTSHHTRISATAVMPAAESGADPATTPRGASHPPEPCTHGLHDAPARSPGAPRDARASPPTGHRSSHQPERSQQLPSANRATRTEVDVVADTAAAVSPTAQLGRSVMHPNGAHVVLPALSPVDRRRRMRATPAMRDRGAAAREHHAHRPVAIAR